MPITNNFNAFIGAAVLGVIGAAGMYLVENYKQQKMRHQMARDLARLDQELSQVKRELNELLAQKAQQSTKHRKSRNVRKANSIISNSTDDYLSASNLDSSDLEFYDVSDDEQDDEQNHEQSADLDSMLNGIDTNLDKGRLEDIENTLEMVKDLCQKYPDNPDLLWRLGKAHHKVSERLDEQDDRTTVQDHIKQGIEACDKALRLKDDSSEIHKWYAILIGGRSDFVGMQQRITDGHLFKKHVDKAVTLCPNDASLHHMLGRFDFEVAGLKWYERKAAAALFAEPPTATFDQALVHFLEAERLANYEWKMNKLMIAKCQIALGNYEEAVVWLKKAEKCEDDSDKVDSEIQSLLKKYNNNR